MPVGPHRSLPGPDFCLIFSRRALPFSRLCQGTSAVLAPKAQITPKKGKQDNGGVTRQPLRACRGRHSRHPVSPPRPAPGSSLQAHPLPSLRAGLRGHYCVFAVTCHRHLSAKTCPAPPLRGSSARHATGMSPRAGSCNRTGQTSSSPPVQRARHHTRSRGRQHRSLDKIGRGDYPPRPYPKRFPTCHRQVVIKLFSYKAKLGQRPISRIFYRQAFCGFSHSHAARMLSATRISTALLMNYRRVVHTTYPIAGPKRIQHFSALFAPRLVILYIHNICNNIHIFCLVLLRLTPPGEPMQIKKKGVWDYDFRRQYP